MDEKLEEQAAFYVFGLLDGNEAAAFERHLKANDDLRAFVDRLDETAAALAHAATPRTLPPAVRSRVLDQIRSRNAASFSHRRNWIPWAIAALLALSCAYLVAERFQLRKRIAHLEERDFLSQIQIATLKSTLKNAPEATAVVVWDAKKQHGVLKVMQVPRNAEDRDYQLWMVDPSYKNPVSALIFHLPNEDPLKVPFRPAARVREAKGFAISLERKGGVTKAEGPIVLLGK